MKDLSLFQRLEPCSIECLRLTGGSLPSLEGIQRIRGLRCLKLKSLDKLLDISALASCPTLEILEIHWCARLADYQTLLKLPTLQSLFLFKNRDLDTKACSLAFAARPSVLLRAW